ncbi:MAG: sulfate adenylyltransferase subunit CysN [Acidobacteriaceae bacterium]|nr:sulfate adenylyltransferase subunit CysN [Acidobacteriaceae bacterium]
MAAPAVLALEDTFEEFLELEKSKDLLRFTTAGSVDDGKSTLIGRLLYDSRNVYEDQLESVTKASAGRAAGGIDFSLLTDGLRAEREQGITIDVAHRYFSTARRKFIIADTPGHEQYTRNMVTGASTAELAIVLVDARKGLLPQSRRHAYIAAMLGLPHVAVAVNKMDLVGYDEDIFRAIESDFRKFLSAFPAIEPFFIPISALAGDNVVSRSRNMPWFHGPALLEYLEQVPVGNRARQSAFRFPVQRVVRPNRDFRGYAGNIASGQVRVGDNIVVLPSGKTTTVAGITTFDGDLDEGQAGQAVTLTLSDEIDVTRGDLIAAADDAPSVASSIDATIVWLNDAPAELGRRYRLKHMARQEWAELSAIEYRLNINSLAREAATTLEMNAIGAVRITAARPLAFDSYDQNRTTGSFVVIDPVTNATVAAGLISGAANSGAGSHTDKVFGWHVKNGALVISGKGSGEPISDAETLELLKALLKKLGIDECF